MGVCSAGRECTTLYSWGNSIGHQPGELWMAAVVGGMMTGLRPWVVSLSNTWGLHDMHGNVKELAQDCWNDSYVGAPSNDAVVLGLQWRLQLSALIAEMVRLVWYIQNGLRSSQP